MIHLPVRLFHEVKMLVLQSGSVSDPSSRTVYFLDSCEMVLRDERLIRSLVHSVPFVLDTNWDTPGFALKESSRCKLLRIKRKLVAGGRLELPTLGL